MKYFAYVRKSTEGEERQALSISSQVDKAKEVFGNLHIVEILEERYSAFKPYQRPVFENMIKRIEKGEADGIIAWHPDRLSRNEIDASTVTYLVRTGVIKDLKFGSYNFDNSPEGIMMLQLALSQSQYYSSKLGKDVKRGMEKKFEMGWQPNAVPSGYMNVREAGISTIHKDEHRFALIRKSFDLMLTGNYSVPQILDKLNNEWKFTTRRKHSKGLTRSSLYRIFTNLFYAGIIQYNGRQKQGKHTSMITLDEFDRVQELLGKKGKPRMRKYVFAYSGLLRCQHCGSRISADKKVKKIKSTKQEKTYVYYRCNRKKPSIPCSEPAISELQLEQQIDELLAQYEVHPKFKELFDEMLADVRKEDPMNQDKVLENLEKDIFKLEEEKKNLTGMSCRGLLNDEEFLEQKNDYEKRIMKIKQKREEIHAGFCEQDTILDHVSTMMRARAQFHTSPENRRKSIVRNLGSNRVIGNRTLLISAENWMSVFERVANPFAHDFATLELTKFSSIQAKNEALTSLCCNLRTGRDSNPQLLP